MARVINFSGATGTRTGSSSPDRPRSVESRAEQIKEALGDNWLPRVYLDRILSQRTRAFHLPLPARPALVETQHTLLGVELRIGRRRLSCPDLATARYLAVFARANCSVIAIPYDITQISRLADDLESGWQRMLLLMDQEAGDESSSFRSRLRQVLINEIKQEIMAAGAGSPVPEFNQNTRQQRKEKVKS